MRFIFLVVVIPTAAPTAVPAATPVPTSVPEPTAEPTPDDEPPVSSTIEEWLGTYEWVEFAEGDPGSNQTIVHELILDGLADDGSLTGVLTESGFQTNVTVSAEIHKHPSPPWLQCSLTSLTRPTNPAPTSNPSGRRDRHPELSLCEFQFTDRPGIDDAPSTHGITARTTPLVGTG